MTMTGDGILPPKPKNTAASWGSSASNTLATGRDRGQLFQEPDLIYRVPSFEQVLFTLNPPRGNVPDASAAQASRVMGPVAVG